MSKASIALGEAQGLASPAFAARAAAKPRPPLLLRRHTVLPGFNLALGFVVLYVSLIVLVPLSAAFLKTFTLTWAQFVEAVGSPRVLASYRLTFGAAFAAALLNEIGRAHV